MSEKKPTIQVIPIHQLLPAPWNYTEEGTPERLETLKNSIIRDKSAGVPAVRQLGSSRFEVIDGNHRLQILLELGWKEVTCENFGKISQAEAITISRRRNHDWFPSREGALDLLLKEVVMPEIPAEELANFMPETLDDLKDIELEGDGTSPPEEPTIPELPDDPKTKKGDVYDLGEHRLICGDARKEEDVKKALRGKKADMVFADPPYNNDYGNIIHPKFTQRQMDNDNLSPEKFAEFCRSWIAVMVGVVDDCIYVCGPPGADGRAMFSILDSQLHCSTTIVWNKDQFTLGRGKYHNKYELIWFGWNKTGRKFTPVRNLNNVWDIARPKASKLHPTMKPIELMIRALNHATKNGDLVLDMFGGSGSTLIACERRGRRCAMLESDEAHCDVIVERWESLTGRKATLSK